MTGPAAAGFPSPRPDHNCNGDTNLPENAITDACRGDQ